MEISNLPNKEFKAMVIRRLSKLGRRMGELHEYSELETVRKNPSELKNTVIDVVGKNV